MFFADQIVIKIVNKYGRMTIKALNKIDGHKRHEWLYGLIDFRVITNSFYVYTV